MFAEVRCTKEDLGDVIAAFLIYFAEVCRIPIFYLSESHPLSSMVPPLVAALSRLPLAANGRLAPNEFTKMVDAGERIRVSGVVEVGDETELANLLAEYDEKAILLVDKTLGPAIAPDRGSVKVVSIASV